MTLSSSRWALLVFFLLLLAPIEMSFAKNRDREFRPGRGGPDRGNSKSEKISRVDVGEVRYAGNGCPAGTMRVAFAPDNQSFSILFDQFIAEAGGELQVRKDAMNCIAVVPFDIPEGIQMEITRIDYRGFIGLSRGSRATLHSVLNFRQRDGGDRDKMGLRYQFKGPVLDSYDLTTDVLNAADKEETEMSPCGGKVRLQINNTLTIQSRNNEEQSMLTLDSIDGTSNVLYHVNWRRCKDRQDPKPHPQPHPNPWPPPFRPPGR